jgi:hypothetical protein
VFLTAADGSIAGSAATPDGASYRRELCGPIHPSCRTSVVRSAWHCPSDANELQRVKSG